MFMTHVLTNLLTLNQTHVQIFHVIIFNPHNIDEDDVISNNSDVLNARDSMVEETDEFKPDILIGRSV